MPKATGKYSQAISDRSGMQYPYKEMRKEWSGVLVHKSEFEEKHPQLERQRHSSDAQSIEDARPARLEPMTVFVGGSGFFEYNDSMQVSKKQPPLMSATLGRVTVSIS
tara:strand:+ start:1508 stop:1831 length:324 start_codon:yes stop_codon:yes gene_type:complete